MTEEEHTRFINLSRYYCHQLEIARDPKAKKAEREKAQRQLKLVEKEQERMLCTSSSSQA